MRLLLVVCVLVVLVYRSHGVLAAQYYGSMFNRNGGLLQAFNGVNNDNNNRDTDVISTGAGGTTAEVAGRDIGIPAATFSAFGTDLGAIVCFQNGFCEGDTTANAGWAITSSPAESPAGTGMAAGHANVLFAPYVVPYDDATYHYSMAYRQLDYANVYDQADIEDLYSRYLDAVPADKNTVLGGESAFKGFVVTWSISNTAGSETSTFQFAMISDGTDNYVFYIYGTMGLTTVTGNVRGFLGGNSQSARICSKFITTATDTDAVLTDALLPLYSNFKCGKPGNYIFHVTDTASWCGETATECSVSYTTPKAHCNATSAPMDSCLASAYCTRDPTNPTDVIMTVSIRWYMLDTTARYLQALKYSAWQSNLAAAPEEQQVFVEKDASPVYGTCGKQITTSEETLNFTFNIWTTEKDRCGVLVDGVGTAQRIFFAAKIFEYTYDGSTPVDDFGPNSMIDKWGDMVVTAQCAPGDLVLSASQTVPNNGPSTPTALPARTRSCNLEVVDSIDDTGAVVLPYAQLGQQYYLRACCDHGTPFNPQADPFGMHTVSCSVSNKADFTVANAAEDVVQEFIEEVTPGGDSCPIANGLTTPPMYMNSEFKVRSTLASYTTTDASFPANPWCIYTDAIRAARWNKFVAGAAVKKLWFKCTIGFCARFDFSATPSEGAKCIDNCASAKRRKREVSNNTESFPQEVLYTSVIYNEPESALEEYCDAGSSDFTIALATVITLIALLCVAIVASILVFVKLLRAAKRSEKGKQFK